MADKSMESSASTPGRVTFQGVFWLGSRGAKSDDEMVWGGPNNKPWTQCASEENPADDAKLADNLSC